MIDNLVRNNIKSLKPYTCARDIYSSGILLDANENTFGSVLDNDNQFNRYPDSKQKEIRISMSKYLNIDYENILFGSGSDELIDLFIRLFCEPKEDNIIITDPSYGMYEVVANINNVMIQKSKLNEDFSLNINDIESKITSKTKMIFICNPNNPTGNILKKNDILTLLNNNLIVLVDEAYIDFCENESLINYVKDYPNLIVMRTFSKAWGLANLRCGYTIADSQIIKYLMNIKLPYNINGLTQKYILDAIVNYSIKDSNVELIQKEREWLINEIKNFKFIENVYPSSANFILIRSRLSKTIFNKLIENNIVVRDRSTQTLLENCLRITVGTRKENQAIINVMKELI